ncbi:selenide, water dikinase SelD [Anaerobacillus alkalidiazotrophicus]|uniref:Selenide, water dikinase n=1 Tax=Anaerobacillus alkalidiazotrophicus TaxID=472963 RepID=A0A1S2M2M7_9BACI|nr:selenide, water dikinase SelD [Anaerobacillus alkalidiazotrophicus]
MCQLPARAYDPNVLVGHETSDDAGVYQLTDEVAIIQTVDFFTPIVDDPYMFGQIAAANSLSDVYAMGGTPKTVLNIVGYPIKKLGPDILAKILCGATDKVHEAGATVIGGHSIDDQEPKFGLSVTGVIHPKKVLKNVGAKPGDALVLTKPIGVGIQTTAIKRDKLNEEQLSKVMETMAALNDKASAALVTLHPNAVTDITGFGLLGHAYEMAKGSDVSFNIHFEEVPILNGTKELAKEGIVPGGSKANHLWLSNDVEYDPSILEYEQWILCDAITSGGLLVSLPLEESHSYVEELHKLGVKEAKIIGRVKEKQEKSLYVTR